MGAFYDEITDKFIGINIFKDSLDENMIISTETFGTSFSYTNRFTNEDKLNKFGLTEQSKISVVLEMIHLDGSNQFLKQLKSSSRVPTAALFHRITTIYQEISITDHTFQDIVDFDLLDKVNATHIVIGIQRGFKMILTIQETDIDSKGTLEIEERLGVNLQTWATKISGKASIQFTDQDKDGMKKYKFDMNGDILFDTTPNTLEEALNLMKNMSSVLKRGDSGEGMPLYYKLLPLSLLRSLWNKTQKPNIIVKRIEGEIIEECVKLMDKFDITNQRINDLKSDMQKYDKYIPERIINYPVIPRKFYSVTVRAKSDLSKLIIQVRRGQNQSTDLVTQFQLIENNIIKPTENTIDTLTTIINVHMNFVNFLNERNVTVLNKNDNFEKILYQNSRKVIFLLYFAEEYTRDRKDILKIFLTMKDDTQYYKESLFFAAKLGINDQIDQFYQVGNLSRISQFNDFNLVIEDIDQVDYNDTDHKDIWSPKRMQDTLEFLLTRVNGNKNVVINIVIFIVIHISL